MSMFKIFFAPQERFRDLGGKPDVVMVIILVLVLPLVIGALASTLMPAQVFIDFIEVRTARAREFIEEQVAKGRMPSDQKEAAFKRIERTLESEVEFYQRASKISVFARFLVRSLPALVWSFLLLIVFTAILNLFLPLLGSSTAYGRMLAITANAALVRIPGALFHSILMFATGRLVVNTSLGILLPTGPLFLRGLLSGVDLFTVWELFLVALGMRVVFNIRPVRAGLVVFGVWLAYLLFLAGMVTISGGLAINQ